MLYKNNHSGITENYVDCAIRKLHDHETEESYSIIIKALNENPDSPEPQNLLGIWHEYKGNNDMARKHYRAAYALDPSYKPASRNLERLCVFFEKQSPAIDFGENIQTGKVKGYIEIV